MLNLRDDTGTKRPHDEKGLFVTRRCPDPNCDGELVFEPASERPWRSAQWCCNGLTHDGDNGALVACEHTHIDGEPAEGH